jgi:outer membrane protein assembly factor BamD
VRRFPESKYAADARQRMVFLRHTLAQHEINVGDYYMRRGAYVAAANRARYVLENHPRTPAVRGALKMLAAAYEKMGLDDLAADARRVLAYNEERGTFVEFDAQVVEKTFGRKVWDYLELDKN